MLFARIITGWTGLIWFGYGLWLIYDPTQLSYMGMEFNHWSVTVEVFAMYGFVEAGLGIFAFLGAFRPQHYLRANVVLWLLVFTGLWVGRLIGIGLYDGDYTLTFGAAGLPAGYNPGTTYFYELPFSVLFAIAWWKLRDQPGV